MVLNEEKRKQGNKKEKLTESLHLTVKIARRSNDNMTFLQTLRNVSSFAIQFSNLVSKTRAIFLFTIKIIELFELHAGMPPMRSAEYQKTMPLKFLIIIHNYTNV